MNGPGLERAAAGIADRDEQIDGFLARLNADKNKGDNEKKKALEFVVAAIKNPQNGLLGEGDLVNIADSIDADLNDPDAVLVNVYDTVIEKLEQARGPNGGRRRRRGKKTRKTKKTKKTTKRRRYTRRR